MLSFPHLLSLHSSRQARPGFALGTRNQVLGSSCSHFVAASFSRQDIGESKFESTIEGPCRSFSLPMGLSGSFRVCRYWERRRKWGRQR